MRILIVSHAFPPVATGGTEVYSHAQATALARGGDDVFVIAREADARRPEYSVRQEQQDGFEVAWINNTWAAVSSFEDSYRNDRLGAVAARLIDRFAPDVAHLHHLTCLSTTIVESLRSRAVPVFYTLHDYWLLCHRGQLLDVNFKVCAGPEPNGCGACLGSVAAVPPAAYAARKLVSRVVPSAVMPPLRRLAASVSRTTMPDRGADASRARLETMRAVMQGVTHFLAPSRFIRDRFVAFGVEPARISVSESGIAPPLAVPPPARIQNRPLRVGFLGSLMVSKAPHLLIEACAELPPGAITVDLWGEPVDYHGDDRYRAELGRRLDRPGVRAHGRISHDQVASVFAQIDVLAVPSIWPENSPLVIREAFLAGVPVVASRIGGIPEIVTDGVNGLLFDAGNAADLRRVLSRLLDEPDLLPRLQRGIPAIRTLADDVADTRARYQRAIAGRPPRPRLAAVVLNYRTPVDTFLAARSLLLSQRPPDDLIVVDNDSSPAAERALAPIRDRVMYLNTGANLGFSGGMNAGIRAALERGAERVLLVNSDVIVPPDCIARLERALDAMPRAGVVGPVLLARHAPDRVVSSGMSYHARTGRMRHRGVGAPESDGASAGVTEVAAVSGSVMLITREAFDTVGLFESDYFFSFEDLDFCLRARAAGLTSAIVGGAVAFHQGGQSIGARSTRRLYFGARNHLLVARRNSPGSSSVTRAGRVAIIVGLNVAHAVRAQGGTLGSRLSAVVRGTRDYALGRFGGDAAASAEDR